MNLNFQRRGRQFFFFTFCVEGRRPVLSRLCKGRGGPAPHGGGDATAHTELLPPGEAVLEFLKTLHSRTPALVASNRVVMPDHVHFILIVDFDRDPAFQPLSFAHRFMEETAAAVGGAGGAAPRPLSPLWEPSFWLVLSFSARQLAAIRRYIRLNPARAIWKAEHPDRFARLAPLRHPILDSTLSWSACGNPTLLSSPFLFPVRLTRRLPVEDQEPALAEAMDRARSGMIPVCGFLSPAEKELQNRLRAEPRARWVKMLPAGLPARFDPSAEDSRHLAAGRLLILSSFPPTVPLSPISRENCELMNTRILHLCGAAASPIHTSGARGPCPPSLARKATP